MKGIILAGGAGNRSTLGKALKHPNFRFFKTHICAIDWY